MNSMYRKLLCFFSSGGINDRSIISRSFVVLFCLLLSACASDPAGLSQPKLESKSQLKKSDKAMIHTKLAQEYMRQNQLGTAKSELEAALRLNSSHSHSNYVMALLMMRFQKNDKAELYFERSVKSDPENSQAAHDYGMLLCQINKEREAIKYFEIAVSNPLFRRAELSYMRAGECLYKVNDPQAEVYLKKALSINSRLSPALLRLAIIKHQNQNHLSARAFIERYFAITEPQPESLLLAFEIESSLNASDVADNYRKQLLTDFPSSQQARSLRGSGRL